MPLIDTPRVAHRKCPPNGLRRGGLSLGGAFGVAGGSEVAGAGIEGFGAVGESAAAGVASNSMVLPTPGGPMSSTLVAVAR